jgi:hypothetical protein
LGFAADVFGKSTLYGRLDASGDGDDLADAARTALLSANGGDLTLLAGCSNCATVLSEAASGSYIDRSASSGRHSSSSCRHTEASFGCPEGQPSRGWPAWAGGLAL